jgi:polar amino acid transport system substrate-binding protein
VLCRRPRAGLAQGLNGRPAAPALQPAQQNGKLIGLDSDIFNYIAKQLHQKINIVVTNFAGMLSDVQTHRVDISIGGIAWSPTRAKVGLFTDPPYYSPVALAEQRGEHITTIAGLQGKSVGTVTGYIFVDAIRQIPGATLHAYQDAPSAFTDLADSRVNALVIDTLLVIYQAKQAASSGITSDYLTPPTAAQLAAHPGYSAFEPYMTGFYVPKQEPKLVAAMDKVIRQMYANGVMAKYLAKWGARPALFLKPSPGMAQQRHAVDRPASWTPPSAG